MNVPPANIEHTELRHRRSEEETGGAGLPVGQAPSSTIIPEAPPAQDAYAELFRREHDLNLRLERALENERSVAQELSALNRMKQDFLANVSHELRTPITAIQGYLSMLDQEDLGALNREQAEAVRIALRNVDRLNRLISDLLDYSSLSRGQLVLPGRPIAMERVIQQALAHAHVLATERHISLCHQLGESLGQVLGDEERLVQAFTHLLENAIKFSEETTTITLSTFVRGDTVIVEIEDQGIGITPEQLKHVFTPFVQGESGLTRRFGGIGMGLALIQHLIALHGGDITLSSVPRQGTTVLVSLPLLATS